MVLSRQTRVCRDKTKQLETTAKTVVGKPLGLLPLTAVQTESRHSLSYLAGTSRPTAGAWVP